jgi:hypothetical protein
MRLIQALSSCLLLLVPAPLLADAVITADATKFGRVTSFDSTSVTLSPGCEGQAHVSIPWSDVLLVSLDTRCSSYPVLPNPAGLERCSAKRLPGFRIQFQDGSPPFLAAKVRLKANGKVQFVSLKDQSGITGSRQNVKSLEPVEVCPTSLTGEQTSPPSFCFEPAQFAVNWSADPVFNNQIFTKGSSIYVEVMGKLDGLSEEDIRFAYQSALSLWAIALQDARKSLAPELQKYIENSTSRGGTISLFTPPQVIRMQCAENALAVVEWYAERGDIFGLDRKDYIAMAQVEGRTVLLNANDNVFGVARDDTKLPATVVNLISVFVHELGHSFGMPDRRHSAEVSVMDPDYVIDHLNATLSPTPFDTAVFANLLKDSIEGTAPGVFNAAGCAGLRREHSSQFSNDFPPFVGERGPLHVPLFLRSRTTPSMGNKHPEGGATASSVIR